ncbi:MAG: ABC transporter substrate-binding protein [Xanthobacteraceae bacterium]
MRRREFVTLFGGAVASWQLAARAQQSTVDRRIGLLQNTSEGDPQGKIELATLNEGLKKLGWVEGVNMRIAYRYGAGDPNKMATFAKELVALKPDILFARSTAAVHAFQEETTTIPILFVAVSDPVGDGFAASLSRPGQNITGFTNVESSVASKWLELLKEVAPNLSQVEYIFNPPMAPSQGRYYSNLLERAASHFSVKTIAHPVHSASDIESAFEPFAQRPGAGLIVLPDPFIVTHRTSIIDLALRNRLPATYAFRNMVAEGGLICYGVNLIDLYRRAAPYIDRILKGEKAGDLPIQEPVKFDLAINLKTAKALGLSVPPTLLAIADELIE